MGVYHRRRNGTRLPISAQACREVGWDLAVQSTPWLSGGVLLERRFANGEMEKAEFKARENISGKKSVV